MHPNAAPEWQRFRVGTPSAKPNWTNTDCSPLTHVSHVAHIADAWRILEDGEIQAHLIRDHSKLNRDRIEVVWLSPNTWAHGSRYGNVEFVLDWPLLLGGRQAYWVESMSYGIAACRILLSDHDYSAVLEQYDPTRGDGPWWFDPTHGTHWWNGNYTLEFMVDAAIPVSQVKQVSFVHHHQYMCSLAPGGACLDAGVGPQDAAARFLSGAAGRLLPTRADLIHPKYELTIDKNWAYGGWHALASEIRRFSGGGPLSAADPACSAVMRAALRAHGQQSTPEFQRILKLFTDAETAKQAALLVILNAFPVISPDDLA
jgi:hypothetical protein